MAMPRPVLSQCIGSTNTNGTSTIAPIVNAAAIAPIRSTPRAIACLLASEKTAYDSPASNAQRTPKAAESPG